MAKEDLTDPESYVHWDEAREWAMLLFGVRASQIDVIISMKALKLKAYQICSRNIKKVHFGEN